MSDFIYVATDGQVGPVDTAGLLTQQQAIWCPPPGLHAWSVAQHPVPGDRMWLVWRSTAAPIPVVLGGGKILQAPRDLYSTVGLLWTTVDVGGLNPAAAALGYDTHDSSSYLRLANDPLAANQPFQPAQATQGLNSGPNDATTAMVAQLAAIHPI